MTNPAPPQAIARELRRLAKSRYAIRDAVRDRLLMLADEAEALPEPAAADPITLPSALDPDQTIRAYAMREARLLTVESPKDAALLMQVARRNDGTVLDVAAMIAAYVRDGSRQ